MAEQQQARMAAPFPAPPPFYKHFTKQNVAQLRQIRKEAAAENGNGDVNTNTDQKHDVDILSLPPELRYLIPPSPPTDATLKTFGIDHDINAAPRTLKDLNIEQLYDSHPSVLLHPQHHLISLARSQLTTFLALVGATSQDAEQYPKFTEDLEKITYNMHDLINQYRPHQARETLILMMEERVERMRAECKAIREARERVRVLLLGIEEGGGRRGEEDVEMKCRIEVEGDVGQKRRQARQRAAWAALKTEMRQEG